MTCINIKELQKTLELSETECRYAELIGRLGEAINKADYLTSISHETITSIDALKEAIRKIAPEVKIPRAIQIVNAVTCWPSEPGKRSIMLAHLLR